MKLTSKIQVVDKTETATVWPQSTATEGDVWVLEDDRKSRDEIVAALESSHFTVRAFADLTSFIESMEVSQTVPLAVVADISLEDGDFFDIIDDYAKIGIPTIVLSSYISPTHVAIVEQIGLDFISLVEKPAKMIVLAARVVAVTERARLIKGRSEILSVDSKNHVASNAIGTIGISPLEMHILAAFEATSNFSLDIVSLIKETWPGEKNPSKAKLRVNISRLNVKLIDIGLNITFSRVTSRYNLTILDEPLSKAS